MFASFASCNLLTKTIPYFIFWKKNTEIRTLSIENFSNLVATHMFCKIVFKNKQFVK